MNREECFEYFEELKSRGFVLGLDNIQRMLDAIGRPETKIPVIHIAGTNGKGSTTTYLASILREHGLKVGTFTSPEVISFNDRISINGQEISDDDLLEITNKLKNIADKNEIPITEFEMITAIAMEYFKKESCDIIVLETGMGGRLDATNGIKDKLFTILTRIGLDHRDYLGDTIEEVTMEKAGIIHGNKPVILYGGDDRVEHIIKDIAKGKNSPLILVDKEAELVSLSLDELTFNYKNFEGLTSQMIGLNQYKNASLAIEAALLLNRDYHFNISDDEIRAGIAKARIRGRLECLAKNPTILLDGAHNPQAVEQLKHNLVRLFPDKKFTFIVGFLGDKEYEECLKMMGPLAKKFLTVEPDNPRQLKSSKLARWIEDHLKVATKDCKEMKVALAEVLKEEEDEVIVIFGSLYEIKEVIEFFEGA